MSIYLRYQEAVRLHGAPANSRNQLAYFVENGKYRARIKTNSEAKLDWLLAIQYLTDGLTNGDPRNAPYLLDYQRKLALYENALDNAGPDDAEAPNPLFDPAKREWDAIPFYKVLWP